MDFFHDTALSLQRRIFLKECVKHSPGSKVQSTHLYEVFKAWAHSVGEKEWSQTGFSRALKDRNMDYKQSSARYWLDIELIRSVYDFEPPEQGERDEPPPPSEDDYK